MVFFPQNSLFSLGKGYNHPTYLFKTKTQMSSLIPLFFSSFTSKSTAILLVPPRKHISDLTTPLHFYCCHSSPVLLRFLPQLQLFSPLLLLISLWSILYSAARFSLKIIYRIMPFLCLIPFNGVPLYLEENLNYLPWPTSPYTIKPHSLTLY